MLRLWIRRLMGAVVVVLGVVTIVFAVLRMVPGDPVSSILGEQALEVDKEALRSCLRLDRPVLEQYVMFWGDVGSGTLGELCDEPGQTVMGELVEVLPQTMELAVVSLLVAMLIAFPLGVVAALRPYSWVDQGSALFSLLGVSIPNFWLGPMLLIVFSVSLNMLPDPGSGIAGLASLVLPAITLGSGMSAKLTRMVRTSLLEELSSEYVRTARSKGISEWGVIVKHALRNAMIPVVTIMGLQFGGLLTGAIVVEKVFARPGIGTLLLAGIEQRNYMLVQGCVIVIAVAYIGVNLVVDLLYQVLNPRIRYT